MDSRTLDEFKEDIYYGHQKELEIAIKICIDKHNKTNIWPKLKPTGTNFTGEFVDGNHVSNDPDFFIEPHMVEITHSRVWCGRYFHQKIDKIKKCIKNKYYLVFANGIETDTPKYLYLSPYYLKIYTDLSILTYGEVIHPSRNKGWTNKPAYRYNIDWFKKLWKELPKTTDSLPKSYQKLITTINSVRE